MILSAFIISFQDLYNILFKWFSKTKEDRFVWVYFLVCLLILILCHTAEIIESNYT